VTDDVRDTTEVADESASGATEPTAEADNPTAHEAFSEESVDEAEAQGYSESDADAPVERRRRRLPPRVRKTIFAVLAVLLLTSGGVATWLYFKQYRPDHQTDASVSRAVVGAATDGTVALLSYSADSLDRDFAAARTHLGGDFLSYFDQFSQQTVAPMARQKSMKTTAKVSGAAVSELHPDSAVVLVFVDQVTTTKDSPQPSIAVNSVLVRLSRINGSWLITKFTPV
jgi:Mce-associated membrane protein